MRLTKITEAQGKPYNDEERKNTFQMLVNALSGEWGDGEWSVEGSEGFWVKRGSTWSAYIAIDNYSGNSFKAPFRIKNSIVIAYDVNTTACPVYQYYASDTSFISFSYLANKKIFVSISDAKIVKE